VKLPEHRVAVKICGLTCRDDALAAVEAGADLLGFNTWSGSRRFIELDSNAAWMAQLPVIRVALLVNAPLDEAARIAAMPFVDALQLHGDEGADYCAIAAAFGKPLIKAIRVRASESLDGADRFSTHHVLLDGWAPGEFGGTGIRADSKVVEGFHARYPSLVLWLAGGLNPENVAGVVSTMSPAVVDVSSGVESGPGRKDFARMRKFVAEAVRGR
jgi:phosphoribosylanthranilate isomerase